MQCKYVLREHYSFNAILFPLPFLEIGIVQNPNKSILLLIQLRL